MDRYSIAFTGRLKGAIGIFSRYILPIQAKTPAEALEKVYDTHEHVQAIRMTVYRDGAELAVHPKEYGRS